jgi:hypothetical protein
VRETGASALATNNMLQNSQGIVFEVSRLSLCATFSHRFDNYQIALETLDVWQLPHSLPIPQAAMMRANDADVL